MRVLIVCSGNAPNFELQKHQAFIYEQVEALKQADATLTIDYFLVQGKGLTGYLACLYELQRQLKQYTYHCVHAHVAMSGLLANLQRRVPVVTTFHGSDINVPALRMISLVVEILSRRTIYISQGLVSKAFYSCRSAYSVIPCGVNRALFFPRSKALSRKQLGLLPDIRYVLFSSAFTNSVKNYPLAKLAVDLLSDEGVVLLELANYSREEVAVLFTAVDVALMTSFTEGSPQFVKEALASNCPVVSTDVGDVRQVIGAIPGCFVTSYVPEEVASCLRKVLTNPQPVDSSDRITQFDNRLIAQQVLAVYKSI
jgi:teichuronic acid biosynthesis glycosyltransferase TuaC